MKQGQPESGNEIMYELSWMAPREKLLKKEPIAYYEILQEISVDDDLLGDLKDVRRTLLSWQRDYRYRFDRVFLHGISLNRGCGDYEHKHYLLGERMETTEETSARIKSIEEKEQALIQETEKKENDKKQKELKELERLQKKYGTT